jgi:hypothetical protein
MTINNNERTRSRCIYNLSGHPSGSPTGGVDSPPRIARLAAGRGQRGTSPPKLSAPRLQLFSRLILPRRHARCTAGALPWVDQMPVAHPHATIP